MAVIPAPATAAQIGVVVSIFSDDRFRGVSISDGRPVGTLDLGYDAPNGMYANLSGTVVVTRDEGLKTLSAVVNGGYAKEIHSGLTADFGVFYSRYSHYSGLSSGRDFTEVYAGLAGKIIGGRISVSPNYFGAARWTAHGEVDAHWDLSQNLALEGEAGLLVPLERPAYVRDIRPQLDARCGISRRAGPVTLHAAVSGRGGDDTAYGDEGHGRVALVLGLSTAF
ncbi:MAG: hypothetical protein HOP91_05660 [Sphingomonas sp.]|nr:hypothetical protein [Sphingomonas sp.]